MRKVYAIYGKDVEAPSLQIIFTTRKRADQVKVQLNKWAKQNPNRNLPRKEDPTLTGDETQWAAYMDRDEKWQATCPIASLLPKNGAWMYESFFVCPLEVFDQEVKS